MSPSLWRYSIAARTVAPKVTAIECKVKRIKDKADHHQRSLCGMLIISSNKIDSKIVKKKDLYDQSKTAPQETVESLNHKLGAGVKAYRF